MSMATDTEETTTETVTDPPQNKAKDTTTETTTSKKTDEGFSREYVERLRRDKAESDKKAKELTDKEAAREEDEAKKRGEYEKLLAKKDKDLQAAEERFNAELSKRDQRLVRTELRAAAAEAGIIDTDLVDLVDRDLVKFQDGEVLGVKTAIEALKNAKPHLFKSVETTTTTTETTPERNRTTAPRTGTPNNKPKDLRGAPADEFASAWDRVGKA